MPVATMNMYFGLLTILAMMIFFGSLAVILWARVSAGVRHLDRHWSLIFSGDHAGRAMHLDALVVAIDRAARIADLAHLARGGAQRVGLEVAGRDLLTLAALECAAAGGGRLNAGNRDR